MKKFVLVFSVIIFVSISYFITLGYLNRSSVSPNDKIERQFLAKEIILHSKTSNKVLIDQNKPAYGETKITIKPKDWATAFGKREEQVYMDKIFSNCKQQIETYDSERNLKAFHLICGDSSQNTFIITNGFGSSILYNALPVIKNILKVNNRQAEIYLLDLPFQGLNNLFVNGEQISGESILETDDAFAAYGASFHQFFQYFQTTKPLHLICLSSSCTSLLRASLNKKNLKIANFMLISPYTGLTEFEKKFQTIGHTLFSPWINWGATGKWQSTNFAYPFAISYKTTPSNRLKELKQKSKKCSEFDFIEKTDAYSLTSQIDNPPTTWTNSSGRAYYKLNNFLNAYKGKVFPIKIYVGNADKTVNLSEVKKLNETLKQKGFPSSLKIIKGPHNLYTGGSFPLN